MSARASEKGLLDKAEYYARHLLEKAPKWTLAYHYLARIILIRHEDHLLDRLISDDYRKSIQEAADILKEGITVAGDHPPKEIALILYSNRAIALQMLGNNGEALETLATLYSLYSQEEQIIESYSRLLANQGRKEDAKRILHKQLDNQPSDIIATLLMELYFEDNPPDYNIALDIADQSLVNSMQDSFARLVLLHHSITALCKIADYERAERFLEISQELPEISRLGILTEYKRLRDNLEEVQLLSSQIVDLLPSESDGNIKRYIAHLLMRCEQYSKALIVWRELAPSDFVTQDTFVFLECAKLCKSYTDILSTCRRLRKKWY